MVLNITAERRVDLSDFGEGWDDCYLIVKTMNPRELRAWQDAVTAGETGSETIDGIYSEQLKRLLVGGFIMNTDDKGVAERYKIQDEDISDVVDAIGAVYKQRALMISAGTYGLKGI